MLTAFVPDKTLIFLCRDLLPPEPAAWVSPCSLIAFDDAQLPDIPSHYVAVFWQEWPAMENFFDVSQRAVQIFPAGDARAARLCRQQQRLSAVVQLLSLLFVEAGVRHGRGYVVAQANNRVAALLGVNRICREQQQAHGECQPAREAHSP
jgi:hypothetical protein